MIPSRLPKFSDHHTWLVYDYSTGEYYDSGEPTGGAGEPGEPGKSPIIGTNGNWYTWNPDTETYTDTGTKAQGVPGEPGAGVAAGGVAGDVLVKASGVDYNTGWTATPPQMGAISLINAGNTATQAYAKGTYIIYNGKLYRTDTALAIGETLLPGVNMTESPVMNKEFTAEPITGFSGIYAYVRSGWVSLYGSASLNLTLTAYTYTTLGNIVSALTPALDTGRMVWFARASGGNPVPVGLTVFADGSVKLYNISSQAIQVEQISGSSIYML